MRFSNHHQHSSHSFSSVGNEPLNLSKTSQSSKPSSSLAFLFEPALQIPISQIKAHHHAIQHVQFFQTCHSGCICFAFQCHLSCSSYLGGTQPSYCHGSCRRLRCHRSHNTHFHWCNSVSFLASYLSFLSDRMLTLNVKYHWNLRYLPWNSHHWIGSWAAGRLHWRHRRRYHTRLQRRSIMPHSL
jgi:hypothetical protein